jgi:hypothetical protein
MGVLELRRPCRFRTAASLKSRPRYPNFDAADAR